MSLDCFTLALALTFSSLAGIFLLLTTAYSLQIYQSQKSRNCWLRICSDQMAAELAVQRSILASRAYMDMESESSAGASVQQSLRSLAVDVRDSCCVAVGSWISPQMSLPRDSSCCL